MNMIPVRRALLSVSNKQGIVALAKNLSDLGVEIVSTGGTSQYLREANIAHRLIEELTDLPEMLNGRVKTLHHRVHGGILGKRDQHQAEAEKHQIEWIDLVVVNFYPFAEASQKENATLSDVIEQIDIGGPTMVRAASKNMAWVGVVVDPNDYDALILEMRNEKGLTFPLRKKLAEKAFATTAKYDALIHAYLSKDRPEEKEVRLEKSLDLRYGENPHQQAAAFKVIGNDEGVLTATQHQGKVLSFNNLLDADAAWNGVLEFDQPACLIVKHANPCGAAIAKTIEEAYQHAYLADPLSAFGGIVALNRACTKEIALSLNQIFIEVLLAPAFTEEALQILALKPNVRVLEMRMKDIPLDEMKFISGGVLLQEKDRVKLTAQDLKTVTTLKPNEKQIETMLFAWQVLKHIKSNGILIAKNNQTIGVGAGQVSRVDAVMLALKKAGNQLQDSILASDAFFPFRDSIDQLAGTGIRAIIQPGGSVRDEEVISACNELGIAMVFTGRRCFRH